MIYKAKSQNGHVHLFWLPEGQETAVSTENKGHTHTIQRVGDEFYCSEDGETQEKLHVHDITPVKIKDKKEKKRDDLEIVTDAQQLYKAAYEHNHDSLEMAEESWEFRRLKMWDEADVSVLQDDDRAVLTIPESSSLIDTLLGYQMNNRSDWKFRPVTSDDRHAAELCDEIMKNIAYQCGFIYEETEGAESQMVAGLGNFEVYTDYSENLEGDIKIESYPWCDVMYGPYNKVDRRDCEYLVKQKMYSLARLKRMFPDKEDELEHDYRFWLDKSSTDYVPAPGQEFMHATASSVHLAGEGMPKLDIEKKEYRLIEVQQFDFRTEYVLVNLETSEVMNVTGLDKSTRDAFDNDENYRVVTRVIKEVRVTKFAGNCLLEDGISKELAHDNDFSLIPIHAKKYGGCWFGKMEELKDPQRSVNHRHSQIEDIINRCAAYGWFYDDDTFSSPEDAYDFEENANKPGFIQKVSDVERNRPMQAEGVKFPGEVLQLLDVSNNTMHRIANVPQEMQGTSNTELSGAAIREKTHVALQGNRYLKDNMDLAKKLVALKVISKVQAEWDPERIIRLVRERSYHTPEMEDPNNPGQINPDAPNGEQQVPIHPQPEVLSLTDDQIRDILDNNDLTKLDLVVDTSPHSPTIRMANQMLLGKLMEQGAPVPFPYYVQQSDLPDKEGLLKLYQADQQQQRQAEEAKTNAEVQKAQIAAQGRAQGGPQ